MDGREVVRKLQRAGWLEAGQRGSHVKMKKGGQRTTVPVHGKKDLPVGTIKAIER